VEGCGLDQFGAGRVAMTGAFEHVNRRSSYVTCREIIRYLTSYRLLQEDPESLGELANWPRKSGD
jgi:hypothetical protein